ncbi:uncharacterized protein L203_105760 [Cryptococcus depauperatus CBS 7841]|uniref:Uncharacterized protein n=1 Tax=Cryptococcus depauperatus CBS 7841 TaxID=1295531 RepID=A0AAJ8JY48_9TREE
MSLEAYSNIISHLQTELLEQDVHQSDLYPCGLTVLELLKTRQFRIFKVVITNNILYSSSAFQVGQRKY